MASVKLVYGSTTETCWSSTSKITTSSLILDDNGTIRYTPLFSGSAGGYGYSGYYRYTLGHLIVADRRVALSQQQYKFTNSVTISYYYKYPTNESGYYFIKVSSTSINNGSLTGIWVKGGTKTTSTEYTTSKRGLPPNNPVKIYAEFTTSTGVTFTTSGDAYFGTNPKTVLLQQVVEI